jgi:hypothetical protein
MASVMLPSPVRVMDRTSRPLSASPQVMDQPAGCSGCGCGVADGGHGVPYGVVQVGAHDPGGGWDQGGGVVGVIAVQAQEGVEVDGAADSVFGDLAVRDPDLGQAPAPHDRGWVAPASILAVPVGDRFVTV